MAVIITDTMKKLIDVLSSKKGVTAVTVEEPAEIYLREIQSKYTLLPDTYQFNITFKDGKNEGILQFISPEEHFKTVDSAYLDKVNFLSDASKLVKSISDVATNVITLYFHPGASQTDMLRGHSLLPIANPSDNLKTLLERASSTEGVVTAYAYEVYNTDNLKDINEEVVAFNCVLIDLTPNTPHNEILDLCYTPAKDTTHMISFLLPVAIIEDVIQHDIIIDRLVSEIIKL